jgi:hypothetical protein
MIQNYSLTFSGLCALWNDYFIIAVKQYTQRALAKTNLMIRRFRYLVKYSRKAFLDYGWGSWRPK